MNRSLRSFAVGALLAVPLTLLVRVLLESSQVTRLHAGLMTSVDEQETAEEAPGGNGVLSSAHVTSESEVRDIVGDAPN